MGWDAQTRTFVIERKRALQCAGCACTLSARAFRLLGTTGTRAEVFVAHSDSCGASFSLLPHEPPEGTGGPELFKKATEAWSAARPVVERAAVSSLEEDLASAAFGDARLEVKSGDGLLEHPFLGDAQALPRFGGGGFGDVLSPASDKKSRLTNDAQGPRKITVYRGKKQVAAVTWAPTCHDEGCHDLRVRWANDGTAVVLLAGPDVASFDPAPGHEPKQQPARVFVIDLTTGKVTQDQLELPWPADSR